MANRRKTQRAAPSFGGDWTEKKLDVLGKYLNAYTTALKDKPSKDKPFKKAYIDAFAGAGRRSTSDGSIEFQEGLLFDESEEAQSRELLDGSARIALKTERPFDRYILIENNPVRCLELKGLKVDFPHLKDRILIRNCDANQALQDICSKDWSGHRAVAFLDPYGMQVNWETVKAIARTRGIDLWLLFPFGIGVNRLLTRSGEIRPEWGKKLTEFFGTDEWREKLYERTDAQDIFGNYVEEVVKVTQDAIKEFFLDRLRNEFAGVAPAPGVLRNSTGSTLYLLCFAVGNNKGKSTALNIAGHLLRSLQ